MYMYISLLDFLKPFLKKCYLYPFIDFKVIASYKKSKSFSVL